MAGVLRKPRPCERDAARVGRPRQREKRTGEADANRPDWFARYMVAEQAGTELPTQAMTM